MEKKLYTQEEVDKLLEACEAAVRQELAIREAALRQELDAVREALKAAVNPSYVYVLRPYSSCRSEFLYLTTNYKYF